MQENVAMNDQCIKEVGKNLPDALYLSGKIQFDHVRDGVIIDSRDVSNLVVSAGKAEVAGLFLTDTLAGLTAFDYIAIGTGTGAPAAGDTQLGAEIVASGGQRRGAANVTGTRVTTTVTNDTAQLVTTFTFTGSFAVTESGILNAASTGVLLARQTFSAINVASGDSLQVTWKVQVS